MRPIRLAVATLLACAVSGCSDPNAGYAGASEFEAWLEEHPIQGFQARRVSGQNPLPFSGELDVVVAAQDPGSLDVEDYDEAITTVADAVCEFEPEANVTIDLVFAVGDYSVPMECPDEPGGEEQLADAAALLGELMTVGEVDAINYVATSLVVDTGPGTDRASIQAEVERIARRHTVALSDDQLSVWVRSPVVEGPSVPASPTSPTSRRGR